MAWFKAIDWSISISPWVLFDSDYARNGRVLFWQWDILDSQCSFSHYARTRTLGATGPLVLDPAEGVGSFFVVVFFLSFCLLVFLSFCIFVFLFFCLFVFLHFCPFVFLYFCLFLFFPCCPFVFCLFVTTIIISGSISTTTPIFVPIQQFFNFTTHFTTNHYHYCHPPPTMFSVPKRNTGKCPPPLLLLLLWKTHKIFESHFREL